MQRLAGRWTGTYEYLEHEVPGSQQVSFTLTFKDGSAWRLIGEVWEDPDTGMDGRGTISGWTWRRCIWFRKTMPSLQVANDPKPIAISDYVHAHYGEDLEDDLGAHIVSYRGTIDQNEERISGTWTIPHRRLVLASKPTIVIPFARGTWQMRRQQSGRLN